jgi:phosphatidate cytidylyltransferase
MSFLQLGDHKERVLTGIALLAGALLLGFINNLYLFWLVFGVIYIFAFYEATRLFNVQANSLYAYAVILWIAAIIYPYGDDLFMIAAIIFASVVAFSQKLEWKNFLPFIYPTAGMLFLFTLYREYGITSMVWLLVVIAVTDIGAYYVGKSIGKTPFSPTSPKKTMEGVAGGVILATFAGTFVGVGIVDMDKAIIVSLLTSVSSIFGDLFESYLKRRANVKDSGDILPGHGGILDRIDGYLFGSIVMLVLLRGLV